MPTLENDSSAWNPGGTWSESGFALYQPFNIQGFINAFSQPDVNVREKPGEANAPLENIPERVFEDEKDFSNYEYIAKKFPNLQTKDESWSEGDKPSFDDSKMYAKFCVSTQRLDRDKDVVKSTGIDLRDFTKYSPWFLAHMAQCPFPIGSSKATPDSPPDVQVLETSIHAGCYFNQCTKEAEITYELLKLGHLRACSVGFEVDPNSIEFITGKEAKQKYGCKEVRIINHWYLVEISVCGLGANQDALLEYAGKNKIPETLKSFFGEHKQRLFSTGFSKKPKKG